jgi:hypothetical protein
MTLKDGEPKVFGDGDVTICISRNMAKLYVSQTKIKHCSKVLFIDSASDPSPSLEVHFEKGSSEQDKRAIEEDVRMCASITWVKVIR